MYCPKCGHQTTSNNFRFCPGCGFWLQGVAELVANDGVFAADEETPRKPRRSLVKRGAALGATLMFIASLIAIESRPPGAGILFFWVALMAIIGVSGYVKRLITKIFSEEEPAPSKRSVSPRIPMLPAAQSAPVADSVQQFVDTTKMGHPSSVTEQTTSRLNKA
ncbi:MAG TPA: hypothetical protein VJ810_24165 [Blastocatellia bacterium]|nr:hypothetical protein [Blastocatellia bacterium]